MLCEKCQKNQATVQMQLRISGHQENHHLCPSCYREERQKLGTKMNGLNMNSMNPFSFNPFSNEFSPGGFQMPGQEKR